MSSKHVTRICGRTRTLSLSRRSLSFQPTARRRDGTQANTLQKAREETYRLQIAALKITDNKVNNEASQKIREAQAKAKSASEYVSSRSSSIQILNDVPAYIGGEFRDIQQHFVNQAAAMDKHLKEVRLHLHDLLLEDYKDPDVEDTEIAKDLAEIRDMSEEDKEAWFLETQREVNATIDRAQRAAEAHRDEIARVMPQGMVATTPNPFGTSQVLDDEEVEIKDDVGKDDEGKPSTGSRKRNASSEKKTSDGKRMSEEKEDEAKTASKASPDSIFGELWSKVMR